MIVSAKNERRFRDEGYALPPEPIFADHDGSVALDIPAGEDQAIPCPRDGRRVPPVRLGQPVRFAGKLHPVV